MHVSSSGDPVETKVKGKLNIICDIAEYLDAVKTPHDSHDTLCN